MPPLLPALLFLPSHYLHVCCNMHRDGMIGASRVIGGRYEAVRIQKKITDVQGTNMPLSASLHSISNDRRLAAKPARVC